MSRHRADVRPRYGRLTALGSAVMVTAVAVLAGTGLVPSMAGGGTAPAAARQVGDVHPDTPAPTPTRTSTPTPTTTTASEDPDVEEVVDTALPAESGSGRRVVFSESRQRVWLVSGGREVERTYLVSGSIYDNLDPGTYAVYSRSEQAWGIDGSGTMRYFVRFTQGENAAIGFHDIPIDDGKPVQSVAQLGTPLSHGCIRQKRSDAIALWEFAPIGTTVVVTA